MKPPRIPAYLRDVPLVWWPPGELEFGELVGRFDSRRWIKVRLVLDEFVATIERTEFVPLTETARQILAGEWR